MPFRKCEKFSLFRFSLLLYVIKGQISIATKRLFLLSFFLTKVILFVFFDQNLFYSNRFAKLI